MLNVLSQVALERTGGTWDQAKQLGLVLVVLTLASRGAWGVGFGSSFPSSSCGGGSEWRSETVEASLTESDRHFRVFDEGSLSPEHYFTVTCVAVVYWHVGSYDRYTGENGSAPARRVSTMIPFQPAWRDDDRRADLPSCETDRDHASDVEADAGERRPSHGQIPKNGRRAGVLAAQVRPGPTPQPPAGGETSKQFLVTLDSEINERVHRVCRPYKQSPTVDRSRG